MKLVIVILLSSMLMTLVTSAQENEGGGGGGEEHPEQGPPGPDGQQGGGEAGHQEQNGQQGQSGNGNGKNEDGYQQGYNQGIKPYSYGYNTGIKPYSYNYYQPLGGKPQVSQSGGEDQANGGKAGAGGKGAQAGHAGQGGQGGQAAGGGRGNQPPPQIPPIPINIDFPDFSAFGLTPPVPPQQQNANYRAQPQQQIPINFGGPPQQQGQPGGTPPPFNYAEYGIPTDVGAATGAGSGSPFSGLGFAGQPQQRQQQSAFPFGGGAANGDDFGIFGGGGNNNGNNNNNNNNNNNLPLIPVLEDGATNNNNANTGFGIPGIVGPNDFSVAASDFEPLNIVDNLVPLNYPSSPIANVPNGNLRPVGVTQTVTANNNNMNNLNGRSNAITTGKMSQLPRSSARQSPRMTSSSPGKLTSSNKTASSSNKVVTTSDTNSTSSNSNTSSNPSSAALMAQRRHYKLAVSPSNPAGEMKEGTSDESQMRAKRSIKETTREQITKYDPYSAYSMLNMDPQYTNPNQGVYSHYPAYNSPV